MRKLVLFMHVSLDGFVAGPNGEMDWIHVDEEIFDYVKEHIDSTDVALYGRKTWEMMEGYWPTAADQPNATRHDIDHSRWYMRATKFVVSKTLEGKEIPGTKVISENVSRNVEEIKAQGDKSIIMFGSPTTAHGLLKDDVVDDFWLFINPVVLGEGIPLFAGSKHQLQLDSVKSFSSGVVALNYSKK